MDARPLIACDIFDFSETAEWNSTKLIKIREARSQRPLQKFVFFYPIGNDDGRSVIFDFSSETDKWNTTKLDRKPDLIVLYQVCVLANRKAKMDALANLSRKVAHCTQVHDMWPCGTLV